MTSFDAAYQYLLSLQNFPKQLYPKRKNESLKRAQFFLDLVGNPEQKIPHYLHVTGTSGKGSCTYYLHNILHAAGKKVGSITSPHISDIRERWRIGNRIMSKKDFVRIVERFKPALEQYMKESPYGMLSYVDLNTLIGLYYFAEQHCDYVVLEVAMGGEFDTTNLIPHKDAAIITNIGIDHLVHLGPTKADIAHTKAGIIKKHVPSFSAEKSSAMRKVMNTVAEKHKTSIHYSNANQAKKSARISQGKTEFTYHKQEYSLQSMGSHQVDNAVLCIDTMHALGFPQKVIQKGLAQTKHPLRLEIIQEKPLIILDGAHNADKIKSTVHTIQHIQHHRDIHLMIGFAANKSVKTMIKNLATLQPKTVACTRNTTNMFRKMAHPKEIATWIKQYLPHTTIELFLDPQDALLWSQKQQKKNDILLGTGSIYLMGEIRSFLC